jgi:hypothetical protein
MEHLVKWEYSQKITKLEENLPQLFGTEAGISWQNGKAGFGVTFGNIFYFKWGLDFEVFAIYSLVCQKHRFQEEWNTTICTEKLDFKQLTTDE